MQKFSLGEHPILKSGVQIYYLKANGCSFLRSLLDDSCHEKQAFYKPSFIHNAALQLDQALKLFVQDNNQKIRR